MLKIKKGDTVQVSKGKDRGKKGKVISIFLAKQTALIEGINFKKKHQRQTRQDQKGGIISIEAPVSVSNLMVFCKGCNQPARIGFMKGKDGVKGRICKKCKGVL